MSFIELHLLQSFPSSNLNRDENNMPKSGFYGGKKRGRISSQCQKRAVREFYRHHASMVGIDPTQFAERSRYWLGHLKADIEQIPGIEPGEVQMVSEFALGVLGAKFKDSEDQSDSLLFLSRVELGAIAAFIRDNWASIQPGLTQKKPALPSEAIKAIEKIVIDGRKGWEVPLFGRMMASLPKGSVDGAVQVAPALGIAPVQQEFDYFTSVDDLAPVGTGAAHVGERAFNGTCYYRYANIATRQLLENLGTPDAAGFVPMIRGFMEGFVRAIPSGHQNSYAAHCLPPLVFITIRSDQPVSLAEAFEQPARPQQGRSLVEQGTVQLADYWKHMTAMYGDRYISFIQLACLEPLVPYLDDLTNVRVSGVDELLSMAIAHAEQGINLEAA